jgi:hypothetical protein
MHAMKKSKPSNRLLIGIAVAWQFVVYVLAVGGVFIEIFDLFGIPWNSTGPMNVIGTAIGFALLELPLVILLVYLHRRRSKKDSL